MTELTEIVGAIINGNAVTNNREAILKAIDNNNTIGWLSREHMKFMSACDLGQNWDNMAKGPTLFKIDEDNRPYDLEGVLLSDENRP